MAAIVSTLEGVQNLALTTHGPLLVRIDGVDPLHHAPALNALLQGLRATRGWVLVGSGPLERLVRLQALLTTVAEEIVPQLVDNPVDADAVRDLRRCGWGIHHIGRSVDFGGEIHGSARRLGSFLRRHAGHAVRGTRSMAWMAENLDEIRYHRVPELQNQAVLFPY